MEELSGQLNGPCDERIIQAAMAHLNLVMIHPFRDGNGRMARCLHSLVLARGGVLRRIRETERLWVSIEDLIRLSGLPDRVMPVLFDAASALKVRNATYRAGLEDVGEDAISEQTASRDLQRLVEAGLLRPVGEKRARSYSGRSELLRLRRDIIAARDPQDDSDPFA